MKLKYKAPKRSRIHYSFCGFTNFNAVGWWFNIDLNQWQQGYDYDHAQERSSHQQCRSIRAFRRKLKKAPIGVEFRLSSRWRGFDVIGFGTNTNF